VVASESLSENACYFFVKIFLSCLKLEFNPKVLWLYGIWKQNSCFKGARIRIWFVCI